MILIHKRNVSTVFGPHIERLVDGTNCQVVHFSNSLTEKSTTSITKVERNKTTTSEVKNDVLRLGRVAQAAVKAGRVITVMHTSGEDMYYVGGLFQQEIDLSLK